MRIPVLRAKALLLVPVLALVLAACSGGGGGSAPPPPPPSAPTVSSTSPLNNAISVATNSSISATFSEAMTNSTLTAASFTLATTIGGATVTGTVNVTDTTATFTPSAPLAGSTQHTATITTAAKDAAGNPLAANYTWNFTTGATPDTTPPTVSATFPLNAATGVALNSSVSATFSEAMNNATLTTTSFTLATTTGGAAVAGTVIANGTNATFTPTAPLAGSTQYTATITTAARDAAGNFLAANFTWQFTTGAAPDTTPPTVFSTSPADAAIGVATTSSVSATFSEAMNNTTLTTASFTLATTIGGTPVTGAVGVNVNGTIATFTPSVPLTGTTQYTATITTDAKDAAGIALATNFSWSFTTAPTGTYTTNFNLIENPISEGGRWVHHDPTLKVVRTTAGVALGTQIGVAGVYDDSSAYLEGFGNDYSIEGTVFLSPGTPVDSLNREIELLLRWTDDNPVRMTPLYGPTSAIGYEINVAHHGGYLILGRFKGAELTRAANPIPTPKTGDKFRAVIQGQTISIFWNDAPLLLTNGLTSFTDNASEKITTGNPGIGFYIDPGASPNDFGFTSLTVTAP